MAFLRIADASITPNVTGKLTLSNFGSGVAVPPVDGVALALACPV